MLLCYDVGFERIDAMNKNENKFLYPFVLYVCGKRSKCLIDIYVSYL